jgi:Transcription factor WhiB
VGEGTVPMITGGACTQSDAVLFDTDPERARAMCHLCCPKQQECLQFALEHRERWGIWGGYTWEERERIRKGRRVLVKFATAGGHGYAKYRKGCRCDVCTAGNREHHRLYRQSVNGFARRCVQCDQPLAGRGRHRYCSARCRRLYTSSKSRQKTSA